MRKRILLFTLIMVMCFVSTALGYVMGGSNLPLGDYPAFGKTIYPMPTRLDMELYLQDAERYVKNCDNDIERIIEARNDAISKANREISNYNMSR